MEKVILTTPRLYLRELTAADWPDLCHMLQDEEVMYAYAHGFTTEEVQQWLENQQRRYREDGFGLWAVLDREHGYFLGQAGLTWQPCDDQQVLEIGYLLKKEYWHQGFATEAAQGCKDYAFTKLQAEIVYSIIRENNIPSQKVAEQNGMKRLGSMWKHYYGMDMLHYIYGVKKSEDGRK